MKAKLHGVPRRRVDFPDEALTCDPNGPVLKFSQTHAYLCQEDDLVELDIAAAAVTRDLLSEWLNAR